MTEKMLLANGVMANYSLSSALAEIMLHVDPNRTYLQMSPEEKLQFIQSLEKFQDEEVKHETILMELTEYRVHRALSLYIPPVLLIMGMFGNILSFLILRNKTMTRQSTNFFLSALALADSIVLFVGLLRRWIGDIQGIDIQSEATWLCKTVSLLTYASSQFSVWLIIAVTVERYIAVSQPLHASRYCNLSRAKRAIAMLASTFILLNLHFIWTVTLKEQTIGTTVARHCDAEDQYFHLVNIVWPWIDAALYALVPFILIIVFNTLIIIQTLKATTWRGEAQKGPLINVEKRKVTNDNNVKLTVMLLSVSFTFLITTFPMAIAMVLHLQWDKEVHSPTTTIQMVAQRRLIRTIAEMLMYLNHSINFYLYCALGQKFRNQVIKTLCGRTISNTSNVSDHSQHLYCSRVNGIHNHKNTCIDETVL